jgi:hypothetical protein
MRYTNITDFNAQAKQEAIDIIQCLIREGLPSHLTDLDFQIVYNGFYNRALLYNEYSEKYVALIDGSLVQYHDIDRYWGILTDIIEDIEESFVPFKVDIVTTPKMRFDVFREMPSFNEC